MAHTIDELEALLAEAHGLFDAVHAAWENGDWFKVSEYSDRLETRCHILFARADTLIVLGKILPTVGVVDTSQIDALMTHAEAHVAAAAVARQEGNTNLAAINMQCARVIALFASTHSRIALAKKAAV